MSALNKMMGFLGLVDTEEEANVPASSSTKVEPRPITPRGTGSGSTGVTVVRTNHEVNDEPFIEDSSSYNIVTLQPRSYSEARKVGEFYREGNPVIINLDDMEESERKRLVDFASGLVFGLHGRIERISLKVFLLSPANVNVSNEDRTAAQATFYNQS
jgi:cell division inhibitor SepF